MSSVVVSAIGSDGKSYRVVVLHTASQNPPVYRLYSGQQLEPLNEAGRFKLVQGLLEITLLPPSKIPQW